MASKGRTVYIGKAAKRTLWRYLVERGDNDNDEVPLFTTVDGKPLNRDSLRFIFIRLGKAAGLKTCHPHMFRHTFAINYLRSDGDVLTLQTLLGHNSLEMVKPYARFAKIDSNGHTVVPVPWITGGCSFAGSQVNSDSAPRIDGVLYVCGRDAKVNMGGLSGWTIPTDK